MKKIFCLFLFACVVWLTGCAGVPQKAETIQVPRKIKTGFYIDRGSSGGGVFLLARLLKYSPQIDLTFLTGEDLRKGKLKDLELVVMPGGSSFRQMKSMGHEGVKALREFIRKGGSYVGVCAGFHITLNRPERARIFPYTYDAAAVGYKGDAHIDLSPEGAKILNVKGGRYIVTYSRGPIASEAQWDHGKCQTLAVYKNSVTPLNRVGKSFLNTPALIYGQFGKGKVVATSFHPEYKSNTNVLFYGCVYSVTGVQITPQFPEKVYHPYRVVYYGGAAAGKGNLSAINEIFELESSPKIAATLSLNHVNLDNADILVLPDAPEKVWKGFADADWPFYLKNFMDRGGRVLAVGKAWKPLKDHANLYRVPAGTVLSSEVLKVAEK